MTRIVFMGSPDLALPSLRALLSAAGVTLAGVVTQPDKPAGRHRRRNRERNRKGRSLLACPVKEEAESLGLPIFTPGRVGEASALEVFREWKTELIIVCAYGQIFPRDLLELPSLGCFNLHFSLLPNWRGASPVQAALLAGDPVSGVSLQRMVKELDAGGIVAETEPIPIAPGDTAATLGARLAEASGSLLAGALPLLLGGNAPQQPQNATDATFCRTIRKEDGAVDFAAESALEIERKCRAYTPWPGCHTYWGTRRLGLARLELADPPTAGPDAIPGILEADGRIAAREGWLRLVEVKPEGKGAMDFKAFRNGNPGAIGAALSPRPERES